jgi:AcrR family transcriptional regulator
MARTQAADYEVQRAAILDCAAQAFAERGYAACSMTDIAVRSGASKARLYHYYASKEAMLYDLLDRHTQRLVDIALEVRDRAKREKLAPKEELRLLIGAFLDAYQTARTRHIALLNDVKFLGQKQQDKILTRERAVVDAYTESLKRAFPKRVAPANARAVTMMLMGAMNWTFTWLKPEGPLSYADYARVVTDTMFHGLER